MAGSNASPVQPSPGRHHVAVAGKGEVRGAVAADRDQVLDRPVRCLAAGESVDNEALRLQRRRQHVLRAGIGGGDAGAADEIGGERDGIDWTGHGRGVRLA